MPIYKWEGKTLKGVIKKGEMEAATEGAIRIHLRQQNIVPTKIAAKGKEFTISLPFGKKFSSAPSLSLHDNSPP